MDGDILVCAPADVRNVARGSIFDYKCSKCAARVAIAPSGQQFLKDHPDATIVCYRCVPIDQIAQHGARLAAPETAIADEIATAVPNTWRNRN